MSTPKLAQTLEILSFKALREGATTTAAELNKLAMTLNSKTTLVQEIEFANGQRKWLEYLREAYFKQQSLC